MPTGKLSMKGPLKFSIITVTLNSASCIEKNITSVLSQSYPNTEHIIIDGGSSDGTVDIINNNRNDIAYFISEPDKGIYNAMNKGIKAATGDILFFLNSDDRFADNDVLADVADVFNKKPDTDIVFGNQIFKCMETKIFREQPPVVSRIDLAKKTIFHQSLFAKNKLFAITSGFSEENKVVSDYEWMIKVFLINKCSYLHIDRSISIVSAEGLSSVTDFESERIKVMKKYFSNYEVFRYRVIPQAIIKFKSRIKGCFKRT